MRKMEEELAVINSKLMILEFWTDCFRGCGLASWAVCRQGFGSELLL